MAKEISRKEIQIERVLTVWGVVVVLWSIYRTQVHAPVIVDELIAKPLIFLTPVFIFIKRFYKSLSFVDAVGFIPRGGLGEIATSVFLFVFLTVIGLVTVTVEWGSPLNAIQWNVVVSAGLLALVTATIEEILARGFLFRFLVTYSQKVFLSFVLSALLFFVLYLPGIFTSGASGQLLLYAFAINILISIVATTLFSLRGSLWLAIAAHASIILWFELLLVG